MSVCIDTYIPLLLKTNSVCLNEKNFFFKKNVTFSAFLMSLIVSSACLWPQTVPTKTYINLTAENTLVL